MQISEVELVSRKLSSRVLDRDSKTANDVIYLLADGGIRISVGVSEAASPTAGIVLSLEDGGFEVKATRAGRHQVIACKPLAAPQINFSPQPTAQVFIAPLHPQFRLFSSISAPGWSALDRHAFSPFDAKLKKISRGELSAAEASRVFNDVIDVAVRQLTPLQTSIDKRIERAVTLLARDPTLNLGALAKAIGVSYYRMSHIFADTVGLPLRSYLLWSKAHRALLAILSCDKKPQLSVIARRAGFVDESHLSRIFRSVFGVPPMRLWREDKIRVIQAMA